MGVPTAIALERRFFRDGDNVWVMTPDQRLEIRPVTVTFRGPEHLLITAGLQDGERIIVTDLPAAVDGMALRTPEDLPAQPVQSGPALRGKPVGVGDDGPSRGGST